MKFEASTLISVTISLPKGASRRVTFSARSTGGSVYYTNDKEVAEALRRHYKFGTLFKESTEQESAPRKKGTTKTPKLKDLRLSDLESAKDEIARRTGISRTKLKTKDALTAAAKDAGFNLILE